jgi:cytochrome c5
VLVVVDRCGPAAPQPTANRISSAQALLPARSASTALSTIDRALQVAHPQQQPAAAAAVSPHREVVNRYCVTCHNEKLKTGGLVLATVDVDTVGAGNAEVLEKVVRKLQARAMPPRGMPRPDEAVYQSLVSHLETSLDRFAAANPNPGRPDTLRRLNRTEYQNAVRDLLDLEADVAAILPSDDSSYGFDNISVGGLSPTLLGRYLGASISRLRDRHRPFPARKRCSRGLDAGGLFRRPDSARARCDPAVNVSGRWRIRLPAQSDAGSQQRIEGLTEPHQLEVSIDGERLALHREPDAGRPAGGWVPDDSPVQEQADSGLLVRAPVKAGYARSRSPS